jgi:hypothetical protein
LIADVRQLNRGDLFVQDATDERVTRLCQQAACEQDAKKLIELVGEINRLLEEKRACDRAKGRLKG